MRVGALRVNCQLIPAAATAATAPTAAAQVHCPAHLRAAGQQVPTSATTNRHNRPATLPHTPCRYIAQLICELQGDKCPGVLQSQWQHTLIFGGVQVLMSQLPNLERCARGKGGWGLRAA